MSAGSALNSSVAVALGDDGALSGARDLRLSFEFRDGVERRDQWARFQLRFDPPNALDLRGKSALRLVLQADAPRTVRIAFHSSNYSLVPSSTTPALGWDVALDGTRQEFELPLRSVTFPAGAPELPDSFDSAFGAIETLLVDPIPVGRNDDGYLGPERTDSGQIRIDDIQLLP